MPREYIQLPADDPRELPPDSEHDEETPARGKRDDNNGHNITGDLNRSDGDVDSTINN